MMPAARTTASARTTTAGMPAIAIRRATALTIAASASEFTKASPRG